MPVVNQGEVAVQLAVSLGAVFSDPSTVDTLNVSLVASIGFNFGSTATEQALNVDLTV